MCAHKCAHYIPSCLHPALAVQAVTTAVALEYGLASPLFAMSLCFSLIVMYDATGVRRHAGVTPALRMHTRLSPAFILLTKQPLAQLAWSGPELFSVCSGKQAEVLNIVITEMLEGHPVRDVKLKEVLGHTPLQVRGSVTGSSPAAA